MQRRNSILLFIATLYSGHWLKAQEPLTIETTVARALSKYSAVRASEEDVSTAAAAINLARTSYLPRIDGIAQLNRATRNNVWGMMLPQSTLPNISGPPFPVNSFTSVWGSAVGFTVSWEPFDFGLRRANVEAAEYGRRRAEASVVRTRFDVSALAADAFLTILAAEETTLAARAAVERAKVFAAVVGTLTNAELRPGADLSRSEAELALARTQLAQAKQAIGVSRAVLAALLDIDPGGIQLAPGRLLQIPPGPAFESEGIMGHPLLSEQIAAVEEIKARERVLDRSYFPKFALQAASYARGTGANPDGSTSGGVAGVGPNIHNWGIGMSVTFAVLDRASINARKGIEAGRERAEMARYDRLRQDLTGRLERAKATLEGAREIAANTPVQVDAARASESQASARYRAGLGTIDQVAEAQRLLTQAEIDDALAKLSVWRGVLGVAAAQGDLTPFLQRAK